MGFESRNVTPAVISVLTVVQGKKDPGSVKVVRRKGSENSKSRVEVLKMI